MNEYKGIVTVNRMKFAFSIDEFKITLTPTNVKGMKNINYRKIREELNEKWLFVSSNEYASFHLLLGWGDIFGDTIRFEITACVREYNLDVRKKSKICIKSFSLSSKVIDYFIGDKEDYIDKVKYLLDTLKKDNIEHKFKVEKHKFMFNNKEYIITFRLMLRYEFDKPFPFNFFTT